MYSIKNNYDGKFYEKTALSMYKGFSKRMSGYAQSSCADKKRLAELFQRADDGMHNAIDGGLKKQKHMKN